MLNLILRMLGVSTEALVAPGQFGQDSGMQTSVAERARQRLADQGLLQVELDAQAEIKERVRAARMHRDARTGASEAA